MRPTSRSCRFFIIWLMLGTLFFSLAAPAVAGEEAAPAETEEAAAPEDEAASAEEGEDPAALVVLQEKWHRELLRLQRWDLTPINLA